MKQAVLGHNVEGCDFITCIFPSQGVTCICSLLLSSCFATGNLNVKGTT